MSGSLLSLAGLGLLVVSALALALRNGQVTLPDDRPPMVAFIGVLAGAIAVIGGLAKMLGR
jgi:hypothetical protein